MEFKSLVIEQSDTKYIDMLGDKTQNACSQPINFDSAERYKVNYSEYTTRLTIEKNNYNRSLAFVKQKRDTRIQNERDAEQKRIEKSNHLHFLYTEWIKTISFNSTTIFLFIVSLILVVKPELILNYIHFGWIIGVYCVAFLALLITAFVTLNKASSRDANFEFVKIRSAIMIAGTLIFSVVMSLSLSFLPLKTYEFLNANTVNQFVNNTPYSSIKLNVPENFIASEGLQIENGYVVGLGTCTDKIIFINNPIKGHAFESESKFYSYERRTIYLLEGCTSIGEQSFRKCKGLYDVYFLQSYVPAIGSDIFGSTWDSKSFKVNVPGNMLEQYKNVNESTWQQYIVKANKLNIID